MATCNDIQPQLSELADGLLPPDANAAVRAHLRECADCSGVLADLEQLKATARQLGAVTPPDHVWLELAGQVRADLPATRVQPSASRTQAWQWLGLTAALVLITAALYFGRTMLPGETTTPAGSAAVQPANSTPATPGSIEAVAAELDQAQEHYQRAIAELMAAANSADSAVDPAVATTVQQGLGAIDQAITESRAALTANPESEPARDSLFDALRRKITVLQATVSLINQMRQGDQEGAAATAESLGKKS